MLLMKWHTETKKLSELKNWDSNPRIITKEAYQDLKKSIEDLGNFEPLVINTDGTVIAGNQRLQVHKENGDIEVEVSVPERELTGEEIKKIGVISNRHSGEWDMDKLANEFDDILEELGFDDLTPKDIDFEDIDSTVDREKKFKDMDIICPHCGETFKIEV
jgi:ParB-like chromosome segregation protein Spo0J